MKTCTKCGQALPLTEFYRNRQSRDGRRSDCKACHLAHPSFGQMPSKERGRRYRERHPDRIREQNRKQLLRRLYGLTPKDFDALVAAQGGKCKICGVEPERLCVDHDHSDGHVRGLLCSTCNSALGKFRDDPALLRAAALYIEVDHLQASKADLAAL